jgi:UDP-N-acetylglucosamine acyltransferase
VIHPTAIIAAGAEVHPMAEIGPWCSVGPRVKIGKGTRLLSHVVVDGDTQLGEDNLIHPFAVVGGMPQDLKYKGERTRLVVGNRNTIRESVTLNIGTEGGGGVSRVGDDNLLMAYCHLGHDSIIGNHCIIANGVALAGHVTVEDYAFVGGQSGVVQFVRVGTHAYATGQSGIDKDVPPFSIVIGSRPLQVKGVNIVGLKRRGFATETIQKINEAMKLWMRTDVQKEQCLLEIESQYGELAEVKQLLNFLRNSKMGSARG